jgi:hypothetical protein
LASGVIDRDDADEKIGSDVVEDEVIGTVSITKRKHYGLSRRNQFVHAAGGKG